MAGVRETIGGWIGKAWSPPVAVISRLRQARMFHPRGVLFEARVEAVPGTPFTELGRRLEGGALARLSGALFEREARRFEVLGLALRFSREITRSAEPRPGDQDLLTATIVSPFTMALSPFTTRADDFLANTYWAVSPFEVAGFGRLKFRLKPLTEPSHAALGRGEKLARAVASGGVRLGLEARPTLHRGYTPVATIALVAPSEVDQEALRFDPFRSGAGIVPAGLVHAIRRDVYAASQAARPR